MMERWLKRFQAWRAQKQQRSLEKWERVRAKGKARYVVRATLTFGLTMILITGIIDYLFNGRIQRSHIVFTIICYSLAGIVIGFIEWWDHEGKYKNHLLDGDIKRRLRQ
jgi:hypothetical protein